MTFDNWVPRDDVMEVFAGAKAFAEAETEWKWLVMTGSLGWGKTHLAIAVLNYHLEHPGSGPVGKYVRAPQFLDDLKAGFDTGEAKMALYQQVPLLLLDDLGTEYRKRNDDGQSWAEDRLYELVGHRYIHRLPTIITSNTHVQKLDPRLLDRIRDTGTGLCRVYSKTVPSYRTGEIVEASW